MLSRARQFILAGRILFAMTVCILVLLSYSVISSQGTGSIEFVGSRQETMPQMDLASEIDSGVPLRVEQREPLYPIESRLRIIRMPLGMAVSMPLFSIACKGKDKPLMLREDTSVFINKKSGVSIDIESLSPGWSAEPSRLFLDENSPGTIDILANPKYIVDVTVQDSKTQEPITNFNLTVVVQYGTLSAPTEQSSGPFVISSEEGFVLLEGLPMDDGRFRIEATSPDHYLGKSSWTNADTGKVSKITLALDPYSYNTGKVIAKVLAAETLAALPGVPVMLFASDMEGPIRGLLLRETGIDILRADGGETPDYGVPQSVSSGGDGTATFSVHAPAFYQLVCRAEGRVGVLSKVFRVTAGGSHKESVELSLGAEVEGRVLGSLEDPSLRNVKRLARVELKRKGFSYFDSIDESGRFSISGLPSGEYILYVTGVIQGSPQGEEFMTLASRNLRVREQEKLTIEVPIGAAIPGRSIFGRIKVPEGPQTWKWAGALVSWEKGQVEMGPSVNPGLVVQTIRTDRSGGFEFHGVPNGRVGLVFIGRGEDRRGLALLYHEIVINSGTPMQIELSLHLDDRPITLQPVNPVAEPLFLRVHAVTPNPQTRWIMEAVPPLLVGGDRPSTYYGLPGMDLRLITGEEQLDVVYGTEEFVFVPWW